MMEEDDASTLTDSTKRSITNPRVEIDTSAPFESVKEAVDRFGGSGPWIPIHLLRLARRHQENEGLEEQAAELEKELVMKEHQTLRVLKQIEAAKKSVEDLKLNLVPPQLASPLLQCGENTNSLCSMELDRAKLNLRRASTDLAFIQESVQSINTKMQRGKSLLLERRRDTQEEETNHCLNNIHPFRGPFRHVSATSSSFETEQFNKMTEASRNEVVRAMAEIERTKDSIKMAEMRLYAAKKMEEAAKAMEAIAVAKALLHDGEEDRSRDEESSCKNKFIDAGSILSSNNDGDSDSNLEAPILEKFKEIIVKEESTSMFFCNHPTENGPMEENNNSSVNLNSHHNREKTDSSDKRDDDDKSEAGFGPTKTSIGDILSRKLILQEQRDAGSERGHVSLSQMLKEQRSRVILHHPPSGEKSAADPRGNTLEKLRFVQRKKFGFIQVPVWGGRARNRALL